MAMHTSLRRRASSAPWSQATESSPQIDRRHLRTHHAIILEFLLLDSGVLLRATTTIYLRAFSAQWQTLSLASKPRSSHLLLGT